MTSDTAVKKILQTGYQALEYDSLWIFRVYGKTVKFKQKPATEFECYKILVVLVW